MSFFALFILLLLAFTVYYLIKQRRVVWGLYRMLKHQKEQQKAYQEEQERQERVRKNTNPNQSSVDVMRDAYMDLDGGEYVDYEEME